MAAGRHHLGRLVARESIDVRDDSYVKSGDDWDWTIRDAIECSRAAILLVSKQFDASDKIRNRELNFLLARNEPGQTRLFVVQVTEPSSAPSCNEPSGGTTNP